MNKVRLLILATFIETMVPPEQWDYSQVVGYDWKGAQDLSCGTAGCAIGWAASIPVLRKAGMKLYGSRMANSIHFCLNPISTLAAVETVFEITHKEAIYLFQPGNTEVGYSGLKYSATAAEVAKHIRRFVKRGGIPGEVVGYAVKMHLQGGTWEWRSWAAGQRTMTAEQAKQLANLVPYDRLTQNGCKVVRIVRRPKK